MPRYDFSCKQCETVEERFVKFADLENPQTCNQCGGCLSRNLHLEVVGIIWNCSGGTRGFSGGSKTPKTPGINAGHNPPTLQSLGLSAEQGKQLGIK